MRTLLLLVLISSSALAQDAGLFTTPEAASKSADFLIQGEYVGPNRAMQVIALGDDEFEAVVYAGGLPGAGWNATQPQRLELIGSEVAELAESNAMKRIQRKSPTLGLKPPAEAIVLFDGSQESLDKNWKEGAKRTEDGLLEQGATSKELFQDFRLHIEFRTPFKPAARGQARGNSGVYYQGRYETQVLDSFGLEGKNNETGGIYSIRDPDLNMCFPPLVWQTYDGIFTAAKFDANGKKTADARLTLLLNGVVVQQDVALTKSTTASPIKEGPQPGPIFLQNHGNPVRFRNVWVQPRDVAKEARRPRVPGFERFFGNSTRDGELGGRILISELGCVACHQSEIPSLAAKQAPILDHVGSRVRPDYLLRHLTDPHAAKPGSTMPAMLGSLNEADRNKVAESLASFLMTTGTPIDRNGHPKSALRGKAIFHSIGCVACHAPQTGEAPALDSNVPLGDLAHKYTLDSLTQFLNDPHAVRPSGRMPKLLDEEQAADVATYLLREVVVGESLVNMSAKFYKGSWDSLPDFDSLEPSQVTETYGFDLAAYADSNLHQFGARFESTFKAPKDANYTFHLSSDDGSRLEIDGKVVVDNDGVHPMGVKTGRIKLSQGQHEVRVDYFEQAGDEGLQLEVAGGGIKRTAFESVAALAADGQPAEPLVETVFHANPRLVDEGRKLYRQLGCADCHQLNVEGSLVASTRAYRDLKDLRGEAGCLSARVPAGLPDYELTTTQRSSIQMALAGLSSLSQPADDAETIHSTMLAMNCYACHSRNDIGGRELARDGVFESTVPEMGDEGRLPPPLDGVGDKLKADYLSATLANGANERAYMRVNMPGFGKGNLDELAKALIRKDQRAEAEIIRPEEPEEQTKSAGRLLAGNKGLACIKCHTAGGQGSGIRAIDMQLMTKRLREDWFHRYLMTPTAYRPGTRMPSSFPEGVSVVPDLYDGNPSQQLNALWAYLSDGSEARLPIGAEAKLIELFDAQQPVIYRNFLEGLSPRGIGVGFPDGLNLAWDANAMTLAQIWKGAFVDASKHWTGRGQGNQSPLGDQTLPLESSVPVALLDSIDAAWPSESARALGYKFLGYRLNAGVPTFRYRVDSVEVADTSVPAIDPIYGKILQREFVLTGDSDRVVLQLAKGKDIRVEGDWYAIDDAYWVRAQGDISLVEENGLTSLRKAVNLQNGSATIPMQIRW